MAHTWWMSEEDVLKAEGLVRKHGAREQSAGSEKTHLSPKADAREISDRPGRDSEDESDGRRTTDRAHRPERLVGEQSQRRRDTTEEVVRARTPGI
jgi:hypothetical protein